ncbi:MAG TPA: nuclear transport factor 2 family protein [Cyclobacteriaceae bacterium]|nr:nuclear transport factor 2 family protein [Cyclobacteriaceae bacterium]
MDPNEALIRKFYTAFQQKDFLTMQSCYHPNAQFSDEVFPILTSSGVKAMWEMLLTASKDLKIETKEVKVTGVNTIYAQWDAWYTFSRTGRPVHNKVESWFIIKDGLIHNQVDGFNFWRWSRQALGLSGWLLGWTPIVRNKVQATAKRSLDKFQASASNQISIS